MSTDAPSTALAVTQIEPAAPSHPARRAYLREEDAISYRPVEVVTAEELRQEEQIKHKATVPREPFERIEPPLVPGIGIKCDTLLGFLEAIEKIVPAEASYPILSGVKISHMPSEDAPRLFLEGGSHAVWTAVKVKAEANAPQGFAAVMPARRARNVLRGLRDAYPTVVVGVDPEGVCLGPRMLPFGGLLADFPEKPVVNEWVARVAMPASYFREVCERVLVARSGDFKDVGLQGALVDFEFHVIDGESVPLCSIVATDGFRIHCLRLPLAKVEVKATRLRALPPTMTVAAGFFHYMREIVHHEWACLEVCEDQLVARADDYLVVAKAPAEVRSSLKVLTDWRRFNIDWPGYWLVAKAKLAELTAAAALGGTSEVLRLRVDGTMGVLRISSENADGDRYSEGIPARDFNGALTVDVLLDRQFLHDAITACGGGLLRLAFDEDRVTQSTSPVVIRGEDEQFKTIIMPRK